MKFVAIHDFYEKKNDLGLPEFYPKNCTEHESEEIAKQTDPKAVVLDEISYKIFTGGRS